jgi:GTPase Era involved in 16S rRNA processing
MIGGVTWNLSSTPTKLRLTVLLNKRQVSIVSPKAQTTRRAVRGVMTVGSKQLVFIDTPGILTHQHKTKYVSWIYV